MKILYNITIKRHPIEAKFYRTPGNNGRKRESGIKIEIRPD